LQFCPTASVLPQGFVLAACAKAPLVVMLLMSSVALPVLVTVTAFAALVSPTATVLNVSELGDRPTAGARLLTVRFNVVVFVKLPDMPVMVIGLVPVAAVPLAVRVSVLVGFAGFGLNTAVTPLGKGELLKVTLPLKPFTG
jgi:hypothetical protein